jgi:hypothetical protein
MATRNKGDTLLGARHKQPYFGVKMRRLHHVMSTPNNFSQILLDSLPVVFLVQGARFAAEDDGEKDNHSKQIDAVIVVFVYDRARNICV